MKMLKRICSAALCFVLCALLLTSLPAKAVNDSNAAVMRAEITDDTLTVFPRREAYGNARQIIAAVHDEAGRQLLARCRTLGSYGERIEIVFPYDIDDSMEVIVFLLDEDGIPAARPCIAEVYSSGDIITPEI